MPVTRALPVSQIGRQPISARPWAISSPPVLSVALPQRSMTSDARHLAVGLEVEADDVVGREPAELHRGLRRQHARIGGVEIAAGWQHVAPATLRRARGTRLHALAVERGQESRALRRGAGLPGGIDRLCFGHAPEHMQPVLDGDVLQVAEPGIDLAQRLVGIVALDAGLAGETGASRGLDDQPRQALAAPAVEPVGDGVFVDQPLELLRRAAKLGIHQRRRQMADGHGGDAALGLRRLSRIADEERIEHRQRADDGLGEACGRQRHGLAGQPFERAVRAHMHDGIGIGDVPQPETEGEQGMARRQRRIVIGGAPVGDAPAIGRQRHQQIAELRCAEAEGAVADIGIGFGRAPRVIDAMSRLRPEARRAGGDSRAAKVETRWRPLPPPRAAPASFAARRSTW